MNLNLKKYIFYRQVIPDFHEIESMCIRYKQPTCIFIKCKCQHLGSPGDLCDLRTPTSALMVLPAASRNSERSRNLSYHSGPVVTFFLWMGKWNMSSDRQAILYKPLAISHDPWTPGQKNDNHVIYLDPSTEFHVDIHFFHISCCSYCISI